MRKCACCLQRWPLECFALVGRGRWRRRICDACRSGCKRFAQRYYQRNRELCVDRTRSWKARLRDDVAAARLARAA